MKLNINPATLFTKKEGARIGSTLFKAKWGVVPVKLPALLKRNFLYETFLVSEKPFFRGFVNRSCERLYNKATLSKVNKESNDICRCQQNIFSEKIQKQPLTDVLQNRSS